MNAMQLPPIEDLIATESKGKDLAKAKVEEVILVYTNVFVTIEKMLQTDLEYFPSDSVTSIKQALQTILLKFESFRKQSLDTKISNDINIVMRPLQQAIGAITSASKALDPSSPGLDESDQQRYIDTTDKFTQALLRCRSLIGDINMQLKRS
jgi:hypothetical protein